MPLALNSLRRSTEVDSWIPCQSHAGNTGETSACQWPLLSRYCCAAEPSSSLETIERHTEQLRQLCWQVAGVERDGHALLAGSRTCRQLEGELSGEPLLQALQSLDTGTAIALTENQAQWLGKAHDLQQRATVAALLMESALFRAESRGGHFRVDIPARQPFWRRHSLQRKGLSISTEALAD